MNQAQKHFSKQILSGVKQRLYYAKNLPMGLIAGIKLTTLNEELAAATVPYRRRNINPFASMYFAVQSMAAELSTAAPAMLATQGVDFKVVMIITDMRADFVKKAKTKLTFTSQVFTEYVQALNTLTEAGQSTAVTAKTTGVDTAGEVVSEFYFTWTFKRVN